MLNILDGEIVEASPQLYMRLWIMQDWIKRHINIEGMKFRYIPRAMRIGMQKEDEWIV